MAVYRPPHIPSSEITAKKHWLNRRQIIASAGLVGAGLLAPGLVADPLKSVASDYKVKDPLTPKADVTSYNNFYEFGLQKSDPKSKSGKFNPLPWTVEIDGLVKTPKTISIEDMLAKYTIEERVYRMRCVEAWSMVIPWNGFPLSALLNEVEPLGSAKYVAFETVVRPDEMPGQKGFFQSLDWPSVEGLRLDEALHPLTLMAVGLYGETLPNQNGAPLRLVVPWKYGFKGIKSIVKITLTETQPKNTWNLQAPGEYGFYANVNPNVDHPRWSQKSERIIGGSSGGFFGGGGRKDTLMFNGYADEVASLYAGMDLKRYY